MQTHTASRPSHTHLPYRQQLGYLLQDDYSYFGGIMCAHMQDMAEAYADAMDKYRAATDHDDIKLHWKIAMQAHKEYRTAALTIKRLQQEPSRSSGASSGYRASMPREQAEAAPPQPQQQEPSTPAPAPDEAEKTHPPAPDEAGSADASADVPAKTHPATPEEWVMLMKMRAEGEYG